MPFILWHVNLLFKAKLAAYFLQNRDITPQQRS